MTENNFQIESAAVTDKGLSEKRPQNEDSYLEMTEYGLFAVADGVGGAQAGEVASRMAVEILSEAFANLPKNGDAEEVMKIAVERANTAIFQMSHDLPQLSTMATTIVALHISGNIATIGHVGDSRLYRLDGKGNLHRETQDHSLVEEELRAGRLTAAQAANHPSRNVISRALGADSSVEVDMKTIMFEPHAVFLLCSDGITRHIEDAELREILLSEENPSNIVQRLKKICYERGAEDNLTAVIAKVTDKVLNVSADGAKRKSFADSEESTVATARKPLVNAAPKSNALIVNEEMPMQPLQVPVEKVMETRKTINEKNVPPAPSIKKTDSRSSGAENLNAKVETPIIQKSEIAAVEKPRPVTEKSGSGTFGRFLSSLFLLLLGAALGAAAYYVWSRNFKAPVETTEVSQPAPIIPYSSFEGSRRTVDKNPRAFIETNVIAPQKAEDFYLLGRAYLLTGKYAEAKKSFEEAKNHLAEVDEASSKTLANEIALGLTIINDPLAQRALEKDLMLNYPNANAQADGNISLDSNTSTKTPNTNGR